MDKFENNDENIFIPTKSLNNSNENIDDLLNELDNPYTEDQVFRIALQHNKQENHEEVVEICNGFLKDNNGTSRIHNIIAISHNALNENDEAIFHFNKAHKLDINNTEIVDNLGSIYFIQKDFKKALEYYNLALSKDPNNINIILNVSSALEKLNLIDEAEENYKKILNNYPYHRDANIKLIFLYNECKEYSKAIDISKSYLKLEPNDVDFMNYLGYFYQKTGKCNLAVNLYMTLIENGEKHFAIHNNLGTCYLDLGYLDLAADQFSKALRLDDTVSKGWLNLGTIELKKGKIDQSIACFNKGLSVDPNEFQLTNNLGMAFSKKGDHKKALNYFNDAIKLKPNDCSVISNYLSHLNYTEHLDFKTIFEKHVNYAKKFSNNKNYFKLSSKQNQTKDNKIRIGLISPDFQNHSVSNFILPILRNYNKSKFEIYCYYNNTKKDKVTEDIIANSDKFITIKGLTDEEVFEIIKNDEINILFDLCGHWANNNLSLFSKKAAPIQISWIGYPNTTGLKEIDYRFTTKYADPSKCDDKIYSEKLYRLPETFLCFNRIDDVSFSQTPPFKYSKTITFGSFNNILKISKSTIKAWSMILKNIENSKLILKSSSEIDNITFEDIRIELTKLGINKNRIGLLERTENRRQHLLCYNFIDISLDTFPFNGATTTFESLWMGVPVLTIEGKHHVSRVSTSALKVLNLNEFIGKDLNDFVKKAEQISKDNKKLSFYRKNLRGLMKNSLLADGKKFTKNFENAVLDIWSKHKK